MATNLDFTNFDEAVRKFNDKPEYGIKVANINDFRLISWEVAQRIYSELMDKLEGNKEMQELLFAYSHLHFVIYEIDNVEIDGLDMARKMILDFMGTGVKPTAAAKKKSSKAKG